ncbi:hypothetical protein Tco_1486798 [Tanacetum coccineum]
MEWLPKCVELEVAACSQKWLDMMVLYCQKSASEDLKFVRQINRLRGETIVTCEDMIMIKDDERVMQLHNLEREAEERAVEKDRVIVTVKTAEFLNDIMVEDDGRVLQLHNLEREAEARALEKDGFA